MPELMNRLKKIETIRMVSMKCKDTKILHWFLLSFPLPLFFIRLFIYAIIMHAVLGKLNVLCKASVHELLAQEFAQKRDSLDYRPNTLP